MLLSIAMLQLNVKLLFQFYYENYDQLILAIFLFLSSFLVSLVYKYQSLPFCPFKPWFYWNQLDLALKFSKNQMEFA
jgi:hypothetical protein